MSDEQVSMWPKPSDDWLSTHDARDFLGHAGNADLRVDISGFLVPITDIRYDSLADMYVIDLFEGQELRHARDQIIEDGDTDEQQHAGISPTSVGQVTQRLTPPAPPGATADVYAVQDQSDEWEKVLATLPPEIRDLVERARFLTPPSTPRHG